MRTIYDVTQIDEDTWEADVLAGSNITKPIAEAIELSQLKNATCRFEFNRVTVSVRGDSNPELIYRDWSRASKGYISNNVGPYPAATLTDEEKESDARIEAENERLEQERHAKFIVEAQAKQDTVNAKLANVPAFEVADKDAWKTWKAKNQDPYGGAVITYAQRWARLMQAEMANGKSLEEVAEATSFEADLEGITGFMYGAAVSVLSQVWVHGDRLRRWHNLDIQVGNEGEKANENGGVLNPALITITPRQNEE